MLIALLGKEGNLLSPQQIYDRLNLVDWDVYRSIIEQIQSKGVLYSTLTSTDKMREAHRKKLSKRAIPRLAVRQPTELEVAVSGLFAALRSLGPIAVVGNPYVTKVLEAIPKGNPYHTNPVEITKTLRVLSLIDDARLPTTVMIGVWGRAPVPEAVAASHVRGVAARAGMPRVVRHSPRPVRERTPSNVFVGNLDYDATPERVESLFATCGHVVSVNIPPDYVTQRNRGFAFVRMSDEQGAKRALEQLNGQQFLGRMLRVSR